MVTTKVTFNNKPDVYLYTGKDFNEAVEQAKRDGDIKGWVYVKEQKNHNVNKISNSIGERYLKDKIGNG
jgi:hypothetical protein